MSELPDAVPQRINLERSAVDLLHEVQVLRSALDRQIDRLDRLEKELRVVIAFLRGSGKTSQVDVNRPPAEPMAYSLIVKRLPDDSIEIRVDERKAFRLPPLLAALMQFLAAEGDTGGDEFVGWKSREAVAAWIEIMTGKKVRRQYVNNLVSRLRTRFSEAGMDPALIQTHRRKGARFALKRSAAQVMQGDS